MVHYTKTDELVQGFKVFTTYFDDRAHVSVRDELIEPYTKDYFDATQINETSNIFGFPYFMIIRVNFSIVQI